MTLARTLQEAAGNGISTGEVAEAIDFDGTNDYLSRASDLTGNADGKTFTFSAWVWLPTTGTKYFYESTDGSNVGLVALGNSSNQFRIIGRNTSGTAVLNFDATSPALVAGTFIHLLASIDLTSTSNRHVYINDVAATVTWTTYTNTDIDFTKTTHQFSRSGGTVQPSGRLSNVYLDYTYRDLSVTNNRRKFITADLKPALRNGDGSEAIYTGIYADARLDTGPEYGVTFDGSTNYLSRGADLTSNSDGKTFTVSTWVNPADISNSPYLYVNSTTRFAVFISVVGGIQFVAKNSAGTIILGASADSLRGNLLNTFNNLQISCDMASASNRYVYLNGVDVTGSFTFSTYTNDTIDFTAADHYIGQRDDNTQRLKGRLAHFFLDYTYRDLSNPANRELFLTPAGTPATGQAALSPIIYLPMTDSTTMGTNSGTGGDFTVNGSFSDASNVTPIMYIPMDDPTQPGLNLGTGGDFTLTGTIARSGRGPNQYNAPYSDLDGAADYLNRAAIAGAPTSIKQLTVHYVINSDTSASDTNTDRSILQIGTSLDYAGTILRIVGVMNQSAGYNPYLQIRVAGSTVFEAYCPIKFNPGRNYVVTISVDVSDSAKSRFYVNGVQQTPTITTCVDTTFSLSAVNNYVGKSFYAGDPYHNGRLGDLFVAEGYIDLSVPANLAKFVTGTGIDAKPVDLGANGELPTGSSPLIYLPMYGNNAGKNYGTGGDFTVNSGPYPGARGPNEFWGNVATFNGTTGYLENTSYRPADGKTATIVFRINGTAFANGDIILSLDFVSSYRFTVSTAGNAAPLRIYGLNSAGSFILNAETGTNLSNGTWYTVLISFDLINTSKRHVYINGNADSTNWITYTNDNIAYSLVTNTSVGRYGGGGDYLDGKLSEFYFTTDYIDFSQEANRLKFRDAFGNPVDLTQQIANGSIPNPAVYMRFDPASFGTNSGTGGAFTVNGTITDGGQL